VVPPSLVISLVIGRSDLLRENRQSAAPRENTECAVALKT
jgi:hypothetical protein